MGITVSSHHHSIDLGYGGYSNLRNTIAKCLDKEFGELYSDLTKVFSLPLKERERFYEEHDRKVSSLCEKKKLNEDVVNFLYRSDADDSSVSYKTCKALWEVIKDYDDNIIYGYAGRPDRAMFKDFKKIVEECAKNRWVMRFS